MTQVIESKQKQTRPDVRPCKCGGPSYLGVLLLSTRGRIDCRDCGQKVNAMSGQAAVAEWNRNNEPGRS